MLWHLQIEHAPGQTNPLGARIADQALELGLPGPWKIQAGRGFLIDGAISRDQVETAARSILVDPVVETFEVRTCRTPFDGPETVVHVLPKPGVTDPEAESARALLHDLGFPVENVRTILSYRID